MMTAEILCVGTELLLGEIVNTNAAYLAKRLSDIGVFVYHQSVVGDNEERLSKAISLAKTRADILFTVGGLGPTYDDITRETLSKTLGLRLEENADARRAIEAYFALRARRMPENNLRQALCPQGAELLPNENGTAPGIWLEHEGKLFVLLPGPPREFCPLVEQVVLPRLKAFCQTKPLLSRTLRLYGAGESEIETRLSAFMKQAKNPTLAPYVKDGEVTLRLTYAGNEHEADSALDAAENEIYPQICEFFYTDRDASMQETLVHRFSEAGLTIAAAESCTGGELCARLTGVPGASAVVLCGAVTYTNEAKMRLLGVSDKTLDLFGAVSAETAVEMAFGMQALSGADVAVSVTGFAGPGGGDAHAPLGTVFVAAVFDGKVRVRECHFHADRAHVRHLSCLCAISEALKLTGLFEQAR